MATDLPAQSQPEVRAVDPAGSGDKTEPAPAKPPPGSREVDDCVWAISLEQLVRRGLIAGIYLMVILALWSILAPSKSLYVISGSTTRIQTVLNDDRSWAPPLRFENVSIRYKNDFVEDCFTGAYQPTSGTAIELEIVSNGAIIVNLTPGYDADAESRKSIGRFSMPLPIRGRDTSTDAYAAAVKKHDVDVANLETRTQKDRGLAEGVTSIERNPNCPPSNDIAAPEPAPVLAFATPQEPFPIDGPTEIGRATRELSLAGEFIGRDHQSVSGQIELYAASIACPIRRFLQTRGCPLYRVLADPMTIPAGATLIPQNPLNPIQRVLNIFGADIVEKPVVTLGEAAIENGLISFSVSVSAVDLIIAPPAFGAEFERSYRLNAGLLQQLAAEPAFQVLFSIILTLISIIVLFSNEDDKRTKVNSPSSRSSARVKA